MTLLGAAFLAPSLAAQPVSPITTQDLHRHIAVLASDAFEGRQPGTAGGERTEAYLINAFAEAGLKPGGAGGLWRQIVHMVERHPSVQQISWSGNGETLNASEEMVLLGSSPEVAIARAPVIFAGHATAEELGDMRFDGAVLLHMTGTPPHRRQRLSPHDLAARGAAAVIQITPAKDQWDRWKQRWSAGNFALADGPVEGVMSYASARALLAHANADLDSFNARAAGGGFKPVALPLTADARVLTKVRLFETANVVGKITGTGAGDEAVLLLAHWDHLGLCAPEGAADRICNGAVDNASGTAILIETARRLAAGPAPSRDIYILATTAEEMGLVGARAFAASPPLSRRAIVAALNLDTTAIGPAGLPVAILGRGQHPAIDRIVDGSARALGRSIDNDNEADIMMERQDGWAFAARGIPTIMATGSISDMKRLTDYLAGPYHKPDDDLAHATMLEGAAEDANLHVSVVRALADPAVYPTPLKTAP